MHLILPFLALISLVFSGAIPAPKADYPYHATLDDDGNFQIDWKYDDDTITIQYVAASQGWAGLGFSPGGNMENGDEAVFWMDDDANAFVSDRHSAKPGFPDEDQHQDYFLTTMIKNSSHIISTFHRKIDTQDPDDYVLTSGPIFVLFAKNDEVPQDKDHFKKHTFAANKTLELFV